MNSHNLKSFWKLQMDQRDFQQNQSDPFGSNSSQTFDFESNPLKTISNHGKSFLTWLRSTWNHLEPFQMKSSGGDMDLNPSCTTWSTLGQPMENQFQIPLNPNQTWVFHLGEFLENIKTLIMKKPMAWIPNQA